MNITSQQNLWPKRIGLLFLDRAVQDTHVLIWWVDESGRLSKAAKQSIQKEPAGVDRIFGSAISTWEIAMLLHKGRLKLGMDLDSWLDPVADIEDLTFVPVDRHIAVSSTRLPGEFHKDPADRVIVATAPIRYTSRYKRRENFELQVRKIHLVGQ